ncbi:MAG: hypothetical protein F6K23_05800 [Okeania sp. SIO2C9]|uniref:hypothetical protein n=1 Tax=Okeania sp. SIO2C9 TaxID=2607791 RepID=UPI0013C0FAEF|nr:hypothetical protein [Okeania sp. SIO2C9]NEQ72623.1 hypothetical protein [Okeania sp. SIO2C9]
MRFVLDENQTVKTEISIRFTQNDITQGIKQMLSNSYVDVGESRSVISDRQNIEVVGERHLLGHKI